MLCIFKLNILRPFLSLCNVLMNSVSLAYFECAMFMSFSSISYSLNLSSKWTKDDESSSPMLLRNVFLLHMIFFKSFSASINCMT